MKNFRHVNNTFTNHFDLFIQWFWLIFGATRIHINVSWYGSGSGSESDQMIRIRPDPDPKRWFAQKGICTRKYCSFKEISSNQNWHLIHNNKLVRKWKFFIIFDKFRANSRQFWLLRQFYITQVHSTQKQICVKL